MKEINLTQGFKSLVDDEDFEYLKQWKWHVIKLRNIMYAGTTVNKNASRINKAYLILMHRLIMNSCNGLYIDHIDHNGLNNMKSNLRICSQKENLINRKKHIYKLSIYKGVYNQILRYKNMEYKYIRAIIYINGKKKYMGSFKNEIEAAKAYDREAKKQFGQFAYLNFPRKNRKIINKPVKRLKNRVIQQVINFNN